MAGVDLGTRIVHVNISKLRKIMTSLLTLRFPWLHQPVDLRSGLDLERPQNRAKLLRIINDQ